METLRPRLSRLIESAENRTLRELEALGVSEAEAANTMGRIVEIRVPDHASRSRRLLACALLDSVLRLDPLVVEVRVEGFDPATLEEIRTHVPFESCERSSGTTDYLISVGEVDSEANLVLDGSGWIVDLGGIIDSGSENPMLNPVGPLAAAALGTGEVFKALFARTYPAAPASDRFVEASGRFSFFDYTPDGTNPPLKPFELDGFLVGVGGVGAGVVAVVGELGESVTGCLRLIDHDRLEVDSLNRVGYARWQAAIDREEKASEAKRYLDARVENLKIDAHPERFGEFKQKLAPRRADRHYDVVLTALDDDDVRHEVQRDLPRVLIDGATGRHANMVIERVLLGQWGCLGCTRRAPPAPTAVDEKAACDQFPDERAPSISFLSALPGILAAGELIKEASGGEGSLRGAFRHVFFYGLNPDMRDESEQVDTCVVRCGAPNVLREYARKYPTQSR
jgi:molybdopterin/thiamine biosynthesis adenylyltransferase